MLTNLSIVCGVLDSLRTQLHVKTKVSKTLIAAHGLSLTSPMMQILLLFYMQESIFTLRCTHAYRRTDTAHIEHICVGLAHAGPNSKSLLISNNYY